MVYTVGNKANYDAAIEKHGMILKLGRTDSYAGGTVFRTYEDSLLKSKQKNRPDRPENYS